jgi:hypothetical protein
MRMNNRKGQHFIVPYRSTALFECVNWVGVKAEQRPDVLRLSLNRSLDLSLFSVGGPFRILFVLA